MNATQIRNVLPDPAWRGLESALGMPALLVTPARALDDIVPAPGRLPVTMVDQLTGLMGADQVRTSLAARADHTRDLTALLRLRQGDLGGVPDAVLRPRKEADLLAVLRICAEAGIAVGSPSSDAAHVMLDLSALDGMDGPDVLTGEVRAGGGLAVADLQARLAERGLMLEGGDPTLSVADWAPKAARLHGIRLATPEGLVTVEDDPALAGVLARFGIVASATLAIRRRPVGMIPHGWRFADFAAGLAALREATRESIVLLAPSLADQAQTELFDSLQPGRGRLARLGARLRKEAATGAMLTAHMTGSDQSRFKPIAARLGGRPAPVQPRMAVESLRAALLEHGAALDRIGVRATWAKLPGLYAAARAALEAAMIQQAPREGARGLALASLDEPDAHGAQLTMTWVFARKLGDEAAQATTIRAQAAAALAREREGLTEVVRVAIGNTLDPSRIVRPG
jgi:alkyldihydroxyacetonephosphate synthase